MFDRPITQPFFADSITVLTEAAYSPSFLAAVASISQACIQALQCGGRILICGNGGSAGDAQHIAGEFLSRLNYDRPPLAAIALSTDTSVLTAVGNDYGYDKVFERQVQGLGRRADVLIAISTSGTSPNVIRALEAARAAGLVTVGFTGQSADLGGLCDHLLVVPSRSTPLIQQVYMVAAHEICGAVEAAIFPG